ncbi:MAG: class I SAM-dependent methyltransferase [Pseudomonadota bacterium]|nr:class I SAM-dependent methyltransferase [Pseudomonadota bacterium]
MLRTQEEEILDQEGLSRRGRTILQDLDRWNRVSGWYDAHTRRIRRHWEALGRPSPLRVLDIGTGSGGLLAALADTDLPCELVGVDRSPAFAAMAAQRLGPRAVVLEADATELPFGDQTFHLATSTLMMHHLPHGVRHSLVREVARVARSAYFFDLEVTLYGVVGFACLAPLVGLGRDAVHDGMLSVRRGSTLSEMRALMKPLPVRVVRVFPSALCTMPG